MALCKALASKVLQVAIPICYFLVLCVYLRKMRSPFMKRRLQCLLGVLLCLTNLAHGSDYYGCAHFNARDTLLFFWIEFMFLYSMTWVVVFSTAKNVYVAEVGHSLRVQRGLVALVMWGSVCLLCRLGFCIALAIKNSYNISGYYSIYGTVESVFTCVAMLVWAIRLRSRMLRPGSSKGSIQAFWKFTYVIGCALLLNVSGTVFVVLAIKRSFLPDSVPVNFGEPDSPGAFSFLYLMGNFINLYLVWPIRTPPTVWNSHGFEVVKDATGGARARPPFKILRMQHPKQTYRKSLEMQRLIYARVLTVLWNGAIHKGAHGRQGRRVGRSRPIHATGVIPATENNRDDPNALNATSNGTSNPDGPLSWETYSSLVTEGISKKTSKYPQYLPQALITIVAEYVADPSLLLTASATVMGSIGSMGFDFLSATRSAARSQSPLLPSLPEGGLAPRGSERTSGRMRLAALLGIEQKGRPQTETQIEVTLTTEAHTQESQALEHTRYREHSHHRSYHRPSRQQRQAQQEQEEEEEEAIEEEGEEEEKALDQVYDQILKEQFTSIPTVTAVSTGLVIDNN
jgi:hypothetical protein